MFHSNVKSTISPSNDSGLSIRLDSHSHDAQCNDAQSADDFALDDDSSTCSQYQIQELNLVGSGAFGTVYRGVWQNKDVALKVFNTPSSQVLREMRLHKRALLTPNPDVAASNIVQMYGVCDLDCPEDDDQQLVSHHALLMEFAHGGPLNKVLARHPVIAPSVLLDWAWQLARAMAALHSSPVELLHCDLKSANILIREPIPTTGQLTKPSSYTLLLSDFGMACPINASSSSFSSLSTDSLLDGSAESNKKKHLGTIAYCSPEVICKHEFSTKSDVWAYGVVLWELLTQAVPYATTESTRLFYIIGKDHCTPYIPQDIPPVFVNLLTDCWRSDPADRPSFNQLVDRLEAISRKRADSPFLQLKPDILRSHQADWRESIWIDEETTMREATKELRNSLASYRFSMLSNQFSIISQDNPDGEIESVQSELAAHMCDPNNSLLKDYCKRFGPEILVAGLLMANKLKCVQNLLRVNSVKKRTGVEPATAAILANLFGFGNTSSSGVSTLAGSGDDDSTSLVSLSQLANDFAKRIETSRDGLQGDNSPPQSFTNLFNESTKPDSRLLLQMITTILSTVPPSAIQEQQHKPSSLLPTNVVVGCSVGGMPQVSPPTNFKHLMHLDSCPAMPTPDSWGSLSSLLSLATACNNNASSPLSRLSTAAALNESPVRGGPTPPSSSSSQKSKKSKRSQDGGKRLNESSTSLNHRPSPNGTLASALKSAFNALTPLIRIGRDQRKASSLGPSISQPKKRPTLDFLLQSSSTPTEPPVNQSRDSRPPPSHLTVASPANDHKSPQLTPNPENGNKERNKMPSLLPVTSSPSHVYSRSTSPVTPTPMTSSRDRRGQRQASGLREPPDHVDSPTTLTTSRGVPNKSPIVNSHQPASSSHQSLANFGPPLPARSGRCYWRRNLSPSPPPVNASASPDVAVDDHGSRDFENGGALSSLRPKLPRRSLQRLTSRIASPKPVESMNKKRFSSSSSSSGSEDEVIYDDAYDSSSSSCSTPLESGQDGRVNRLDRILTLQNSLFHQSIEQEASSWLNPLSRLSDDNRCQPRPLPSYRQLPSSSNGGDGDANEIVDFNHHEPAINCHPLQPSSRPDCIQTNRDLSTPDDMSPSSELKKRRSMLVKSPAIDLDDSEYSYTAL